MGHWQGQREWIPESIPVVACPVIFEVPWHFWAERDPKKDKNYPVHRQHSGCGDTQLFRACWAVMWQNHAEPRGNNMSGKGSSCLPLPGWKRPENGTWLWGEQVYIARGRGGVVTRANGARHWGKGQSGSSSRTNQSLKRTVNEERSQ